MKHPNRLALVLLCVPARALAQPPAPSAWGAPPPAQVVAQPPAPLPPPPEARGDSLGAVPRAKHALYISGTSLLLLNSAGVSYGFRPLRALAVSVGAGLSGAYAFFGSVSAVGGQLMVHGLFGDASAHSFELAGGVSVLDTNSAIFCSDCGSVSRVAALPAAFIGYRYHPLDGGFLFRGGVAWDFGLAIGLSVSFGAAF